MKALNFNLLPQRASKNFFIPNVFVVTTSHTDIDMYTIHEATIAQLEDRIAELEDRVAELEDHDLDEEESVIVLREISREEALQEVKELLSSSGNPLDHGEVADELRLELRLVADVCTELIEKGIIEFA